MRVVHSRKKVWEKDYAFEDNFILLTWILALLKWKEYGFKTVLYTDYATLINIQKYRFEYLYDEINTTYIDEHIQNIDLAHFWAMPKILSYQAELELGHTNSFVADVDIVPMKDWHDILSIQGHDLTVWSNKEFLEAESTYPRIDSLSLPHKYKLPAWFRGNVRPLNTGIIYFKNPQHALNYLHEVTRYATNNKNPRKNTVCQTMCTAEQRMIGEYARAKSLIYNIIEPLNEGLFNKNGFHTHIYKQLKDRLICDQLALCFLNKIKEYDNELYNNLIQLPLSKPLTNIKEYIVPPELQQYNW